MRLMRLMRRAMLWISLLILLLFIGPLVVLATGGARLRGDWRTASHEPTGQAPAPSKTPQAVVQVYAARAFAWRGAFSVHTWIAVKPRSRRALHALRSHWLALLPRSVRRQHQR